MGTCNKKNVSREFPRRAFYPLHPMNRPPPPADDTSSLERYVIPNLRNACRIMKLLAQHPDGLKAAEIARMLKIPVTTTLRIMATLQLEGYARKMESRFELGPVLIHLGNASLAGTEIRTAALPVLQDLTGRTDETSHLAVPCDDHALIVAVQDSPHPLRAASRPGSLTELHCSSTGKVFIAYVYSQRLEEFYGKARVTKRTAHTQDTLAEIKREANLTRKRGFSLDDEEFNLGVRCCAAPVFSSDGSVVAAIGITAATVRFTPERVPEISSIVTSAANELSQRMGYHGAR
jgi:DNA-binding IclR family transcriptional regulator